MTANPIAEMISALIPDEVRAESNAIAEQVRALIPTIVPLIERAQALNLETTRLYDESEAAVTASMDPDRAVDAADGWGPIWDSLGGANEYREAFHELDDLVRAWEGHPEVTT